MKKENGTVQVLLNLPTAIARGLQECVAYENLYGNDHSGKPMCRHALIIKIIGDYIGRRKFK